MSLAQVLTLADGRFPSGGHAHSGGLEAAVTRGRVRDVTDLRSFLSGRLATTGLVSACFAAAACGGTDVTVLEGALCARTPSAALRSAASKQGRALGRAAAVIWPSFSAGPLSYPVALGAVAAHAGLTPFEAATVAAHSTVSGPASAAVRLLGLDPFQVYAVIAALAGDCDAVATRAVEFARGPVDDLPAASAPLLDASAEDHAGWEVRLFAS
jgi:urease accessory protein